MSRVLPLSLLALSASAKFTAEYVSFGSSEHVKADVNIPAASFALPFTGKAPRSAYKKHNRDALRSHRAGGAPVAPLAGSGFDEEYLVNITIGGQHFPVILDTGSSDLWLVEKGFSCFNLTSFPEPPAACAFGSDGFDPSKSKTFKAYPNHNFNISYGDGEFLTGSVGFDTVDIGGLKVSHQEFGVVNKAAWNGDGINSGLLGLASPGLTSVFNGTDPDLDQEAVFEEYNPFFYSAVQDKDVKNPYFSIAINRGTFEAEENKPYDPNLGYIAFGGVAPVPTIAPTVTSPWLGITTRTRGTGYFYYIVGIEKYTFPGSANLTTASNITILDSGTTLNYVPTDVAAAYNAAFDPPAYNDDEQGGYVVDCTAKVPPFEVTVGGKSFSIDGRDQLLPLGINNTAGNELCFTGTQDGGFIGNFYVLGDVFLHNVVATFNIQAKQITLSQRKPY